MSKQASFLSWRSSLNRQAALVRYGLADGPLGLVASALVGLPILLPLALMVHTGPTVLEDLGRCASGKLSPGSFLSGVVVAWMALVLSSWLASWVDASWTFTESERTFPVAAAEVVFAHAVTKALRCLTVFWTGALVVLWAAHREGASPGLLGGIATRACIISGFLLLACAIRHRRWPSLPPLRRRLAVHAAALAMLAAGLFLAPPSLCLGAAATALLLNRPARPTPARVPLGHVLFPYELLVPAFLVVGGLMGYRTGARFAPALAMPAGFGAMLTWRRALRLLGHLPISRRRLFARMVVPSLIAYGFVASLMSVGPVPFPMLVGFQCTSPAQRAETRVCDIAVPASFWRVGWEEAPVIEAPDGEAHRPTPERLRPASSLLVYNPYEVEASASRSFMRYQLSRALADCCDLHVSPAEIDRRYFAGGAYGVGLSTSRFPELRVAWRPSTLASDLSLGLLLSLLGLLWTFALPVGGSMSPRQWFAPSLLFLAILGLGTCPALTGQFQYCLSNGVPASVLAYEAELRWLGALWNGYRSVFAAHPWPSMVVAAGLFTVGYRAVERRFVRMEPTEGRGQTSFLQLLVAKRHA